MSHKKIDFINIIFEATSLFKFRELNFDYRNSPTNMNSKNYKTLLVELEQLEIDDEATAQTYSQLLALYLYENEMCYAKFLWKRIPKTLKNNCPELISIWNVGQKMWKQDWSGVYEALSIKWSKTVSEIMDSLKERIKERALNLISEAYSSLNFDALSKMTGTNLENARLLAIERGWDVSSTTVRPVKIQKQDTSNIEESATEEKLHKLAQFVSFLEN